MCVPAEGRLLGKSTLGRRYSKLTRFGRVWLDPARNRTHNVLIFTAWMYYYLSEDGKSLPVKDGLSKS
jgi:hypothetical protein